MNTRGKSDAPIRKRHHIKTHGIRGRSAALIRSNARCARYCRGNLSRHSLKNLAELTKMYGLSVPAGHLQFLDGRWYITHSGLLSVAQRNRCTGIRTIVEKQLSDAGTGRWVFKAIVYKPHSSKGFVGYGDADPSNTSPLVRGAEMRVAETRAVNRALRKAYGIGLCSVEELGSFFDPPKSFATPAQSNGSRVADRSNNGQPRLRDQLCLLIRQYNLDPTLVKAYTAEFCGTQTLKEASRDLVESFISQLAASAKNDREGLVCKLNSYAQPQGAKP